MREFQCPPGHDPSKPYIEFLVSTQGGVVSFSIRDVYLPEKAVPVGRGWLLNSVDLPQVVPADRVLYVWGGREAEDGKLLQLSWKSWQRMLRAIKDVGVVKLSFMRTLEQEFFERVGI